MKKFLNKICALATLLATGAAFTACSSDSDITGEEPNNGKNPAALVGKSYNMKIGVNKGSDATRALVLDGDVLRALWYTTDNIYVYSSEWKKFGGQLKPADNDNELGGSTQQPTAKNTVVGTITSTEETGELEEGSTVNFVFPRTTWDYTGQDGTLETLAKKYDYATGTAEITGMDDEENITAVSPDPVPFETKQAIVKINFVAADGTTPLSSSKLTISDDKGNLVQSVSSFNNGTETKGDLVLQGSSKSTWYVAMRGVTSGSTLTFTTLEGTTQRAFVKKINQNLENGYYYELTLQAETADDALTIEAAAPSTRVSFYNNAAGPVLLKVYNADETLRNIVTVPAGKQGNVQLTEIGQKVLFYGDNDTYTTFTGDGSNEDDVHYSYVRVNASRAAYLYNNIMSLCNGEDWATDDNTTLRGNATFAGLFKGTSVTQKQDKKLILPATTLKEGCYQDLLRNSLFTDVKDIDLPATTLQPYCYSGMFAGTKITESPLLRAETLVKGCYNDMFNSCGTQFTTIRCYAMNIPHSQTDPSLFNSCTANWVQGTTTTEESAKNGKFYVNPKYSTTVVKVANEFATHPTESQLNVDGQEYVKENFMGSNSTDKMCFKLGTGGIHDNWSVLSGE